MIGAVQNQIQNQPGQGRSTLVAMAKSQVVTQLAPDEAVARLVPQLTKSGATIHSSSSQAITGEVVWKKRPSMVIAIVLLLLIILPGILYLIFGSKTIHDPFSITLSPAEGGTTVTAAGQGEGEKAAKKALAKL